MQKINNDFERSTLDLGVIGNCAYNALINPYGRIVWCCLPLFNSAPIFSRLVSGDKPPDCEKGFFDITIKDFAKAEQKYLQHTAILETKLHDKNGNVLKITDFAPRFLKNGRFYCPQQFVRMLSVEKGLPRIKVRVRPVTNYGEKLCETSFGSNHISYYSDHYNARLTTDVPIDFIRLEKRFILNRPRVIFFGNDESFRDNVTDVGNEFYQKTKDYWINFSKSMHLPLEWQEDVIRAAITLKMCQVESSGAIVAAMTSSIPEAKNSQRNWDYRFCWLRDSYHIIQALNGLGATCTMENYINFIANIVPDNPNDLQPLYGILMEKKLSERECSFLKGYRGQGPVRIGNSAYNQKQNDNYGNIILSILLVYYDVRFSFKEYESVFERLEGLGEEACKDWNQMDAGIWELRNNNHVHTFSSVMCWVTVDRLAKIAKKLNHCEKAVMWRKKADKIHKEIMDKSWCAEEESFMATLLFPEEEDKTRTLDASVLLLAKLKFVDPMDPRFVKTVKKIEEKLVRNQFCFRYISQDDFGKPENSFIICTFWLIEALCLIGECSKAREMFENLLKYRNHVGLFSEDIDPNTKELWGNFPQAYSMVGIINSAAIISESWEKIGF